ncbi:6-phosphogluconolactonase [Granulibacter bethesdensis]|uniref:6-phosphogluconolactonase n=1 Tax=Granulibacter bethesdensis TaxID=364410 RepID=UPI0003F207EA|nr:6-phosphogluconolactonase [Granulibacter bethesdensis]AHJ66762.1 6-phosphogluconolactonase [Granulibacter bethesdensis CGDNIH4]
MTNPGAAALPGQLVVLDTAQALADHVAAWLAERIQKSQAPVRIALSGGSTPRKLYQTLAQAPWNKQIDWTRVHLYWGDERFVPHDDPDSNFHMTNEALLSHIDIPPSNVFPIPGEGDPVVIAERYEARMKADYGTDTLDPEKPFFDVVFLGLGEDGHTASLIPGQPILKEREKWVAAVSEGRPEVRISLTYPALESASVIAFLVTGKGKAEIIKAVREGTTDVPAAHLRPHGQVIWFTADGAASPE